MTSNLNQTIIPGGYLVARRTPGRKVVSIPSAELKPYDRYGPVQEKMYWQPLNYDFESGAGNYILRLEPGAKSTPHTHTDMEQILVLDGSLKENDGQVFGPGDHITYFPGSTHSSSTDDGCLLVAQVVKHYEFTEPCDEEAGTK
jgi:D-lyxose ketol-isomerase